MADNVGFAALGKPVPYARRTAGMDHLKSMGVESAKAWECVGLVTNTIERDQTYEAIQLAMQTVDLIGAHRLLAVLCTEAPSERTHAD